MYFPFRSRRVSKGSWRATRPRLQSSLPEAPRSDESMCGIRWVKGALFLEPGRYVPRCTRSVRWRTQASVRMQCHRWRLRRSPRGAAASSATGERGDRDPRLGDSNGLPIQYDTGLAGLSATACPRHRNLALLPRRSLRRVYRLISGVTEMPWNRTDAATVVSVIAMRSSANGPGMS